MFKLINIFAIIGLAMGTEPAPWDIEHPEAPLCPADSMKKMDEETRNFFVSIWGKVEGLRAAEGFDAHFPSFTTAVHSVCHRLPSGSINNKELKVFLIAYLLIEGFVTRFSAEELAENAGLKRPLQYPIMKMAIEIDSMQSDTDNFIKGEFNHRPGALYSDEVEAVLSILDEKKTTKLINGILKIATLLADAQQHRRGPMDWEFPSLARYDFRSLIELAGPAGVEPVLGLIMKNRAAELFNEDQLRHTQLTKFSSKGFKLWYTAMISFEKFDISFKHIKIWEARTQYNWKEYLLSKVMRHRDEEVWLHRLLEDVKLLEYNGCLGWTKRFTKAGLFTNKRFEKEFVKKYPCDVLFKKPISGGK